MNEYIFLFKNTTGIGQGHPLVHVFDADSLATAARMFDEVYPATHYWIISVTVR